jgi:mono/diheme cytochrome c family protein
MDAFDNEIPSAEARKARRVASLGLLLIAASAISACSGGSGAGTQENPSSQVPGVSDYTGPPPATADVQSFKLNLWDNIQSSNRCGSCHSVEGGQGPMFARRDDVNLAYADANSVVMLTSPVDSQMVLKVGGGHNCWLTSDAACADILTTWITNWAGALAGAGGREITLEAPPLRDPGRSRNFPSDPAAFAATVYPVLEDNCAGCHASSSAVQQSPFFAEGPGTDPAAVAAAYAAARSKINLDAPADSRFVVRLRDEAHNCWTTSCADDADTMEAAIAAFASGVTPTEVDPNFVTSKALTLYEGTIASGGNRYEASVIANYEFKTGSGTTAFDTSGVEPAMDLTLSGSVEWFGGWGLRFSGGKAQGSTAASAKLRRMITATGEYSIEAWVAPGNVVQEGARIVSYSAGTMARNFNLGQTMYNYDFFNRSSTSDGNGNPQLSTPDAAEVLQATLQHVVATYSPVDGRKIYVNGALAADQDPAPPGNLSDWDDTFAFVLGNEVSGDRTFIGALRLVAIHNRALTPEQIVQNFEAGVGEKFFLLFSVEELTGVSQSFVVFEAAVFDTYAYLFRAPFFISLDPAATPDGIDLDGIRIGLNGTEAPVGQAFANVVTTLSSSDYNPATGQPLSALGAVVPLQKGPDSDEFFLTFDQLGANAYARPAPAVPAPPVPQDLPAAAAIGVRTFDEISATMAAITGVSELHAGVRGTFGMVRESLPAVEQIEAVLASHQVAIAQLAIEYCNALIDDVSLRTTTFPLFPWNAPPAVAFPGSQDALFDPLLDRVLGVTQIATQPDRAAVESELDQMINGRIPADPSRPGLATTGTNDSGRTADIAKAVCSAVVGSAAMLVQ